MNRDHVRKLQDHVLANIEDALTSTQFLGEEVAHLCDALEKLCEIVPLEFGEEDANE